MARLNQMLFVSAKVLGRQGGQTLTEYALILLFVAFALVLALSLFAGGLDDFYQTAAAAFP